MVKTALLQGVHPDDSRRNDLGNVFNCTLNPFALETACIVVP
ncbi:hypothetical protein SDC9_156974 [bioreactor metagenome]|uniref:Uncharacterized protein n=1 Tax=bioreactor metagenome TaxID=1076179 RepID=A0A645F824_9ZZZZ